MRSSVICCESASRTTVRANSSTTCAWFKSQQFSFSMIY
jgi:hypothetical protein